MAHASGLIAIVLSLLAGAGSGTTSIRHEPGEITVESWNIRFDNPADGPHAWPKRREAVIDHLEAGGIDVIGLQEVLPHQLSEIREGLPGFEAFARSRERDVRRGEAVPILWRRDRWRIDPGNSSHFWLSETPDVPGSMSWNTACTRMVTVVRLEPAGSGEGAVPRRPIWVFNVHLDHRSADARLNGARLLRSRIDDLAATHPGEPIVVMGDFNTTPGSPPMVELCGPSEGRGLRDAWATVEGRPTDAPRGTWNGWKRDAGTTSRERRIDLVLVKGLEVRSADILRPTNESGPLSDHWPVRAVLRVPGGRRSDAEGD